jgi:hypothetical protein
MTLAEYHAALARIEDVEIYPEIPKDIFLTVAPESLDDTSECQC